MAGLNYTVLAPPSGPPNLTRARGLIEAFRFDRPTPYSSPSPQVIPGVRGTAATWSDSGIAPTELAHRASPWGPGLRFRTAGVFTGFTGWTLPTGFPKGLGTTSIPDFTIAALLSYEHTGSGSGTLLYRHHDSGFGNRLQIFLLPTTPISMSFGFGNDATLSFPSGITMAGISRLVVVKRASTWSVYLNGVLMGTASAGASTIAGNDADTPLWLYTCHDGWRVEGELWGRGWTANEVAEDARDPWRLWRQEPLSFSGARRVAVPWHLLHSANALGV